MAISFRNLIPYIRLGKEQTPEFFTDNIPVPVSVDVAGFTTLTVELSLTRDFTVAGEVLTGAAITRVDAKTIEVDLPRFGGTLDHYQDSFYKVKRDGVVIGLGQFLHINTAAKAVRKRRHRR